MQSKPDFGEHFAPPFPTLDEFVAVFKIAPNPVAAPVRPPLLALGGKKGAGKDSIAKLITIGYRYGRVALADALKDELCELYDIERWEFDTPIIKELHRPLMKKHGMMRREQDPAYWLKKAHLFSASNVVVTDCRMENERALVRSRGGVNIWIANDEAERVADSHATESASASDYDFVIVNDKTNCVTMMNSIKSVMQECGVGDPLVEGVEWYWADALTKIALASRESRAALRGRE